MSMSAEWRAVFCAFWVCCLFGWQTVTGISLFHLPKVQITIETQGSVSFRVVFLVLSQWQSCSAVRDCPSNDLVMLRKLARLTVQWKMNQIRNLYNGNFQCEIYSKNTVLIILFNIKGNSMRALNNCLAYSWRVPFNWIYFCSISI